MLGNISPFFKHTLNVFLFINTFQLLDNSVHHLVVHILIPSKMHWT